MQLEKYSFGVGDRFAHQAKAQLQSVQKARENGIDLVPVWNKSFREHKTVGSTHAETRKQVEEAVKALNWQHPYYLDADHINLKNVDEFLDHANFFTIDVADYIGQKAGEDVIEDFVQANLYLTPKFELPGIEAPFPISEVDIWKIAEKYLFAVKKAGEIYRYIESKKGKDNFVVEVSMDETNSSQKPLELLLLLQALADEDVPLQTIAPKFPGRFNKGIDYQGDIEEYRQEFESGLLILDFAEQNFGFPHPIKFSVHTGSDKFSIYPVMREIIRKYGKGLHIKTAGTTWLEEVIGMSRGGADGLEMAKSIYNTAWSRVEQLTEAYSKVIDIDKAKLPEPKEVGSWSAQAFVNALRHNPENKEYNPHFRQLMHVAYKIAAEKGSEYTALLKKYSDIIAEDVIYNLYNRHILRIFEPHS